MSTLAAVAEALTPWFGERLAAAELEILDLRRHAEGWSWQTYTMDVAWRSAETGEQLLRGYAVRVEPQDGLLAPYDIDGQYRLHRAILDHSDVPMPALYWLELDPAVLGMPFFVMERLRGVVPVQWRGNDPTIFPSDEARREIGLQFVDIEARIHGVDWRAAGLDLPGGHVADPVASARFWVGHWARYYEESILVELPLMRYAIGWLRSNVSCSGTLTLCHGDYRIGNFMLADGIVGEDEPAAFEHAADQGRHVCADAARTDAVQDRERDLPGQGLGRGWLLGCGCKAAERIAARHGRCRRGIQPGGPDPVTQGLVFRIESDARIVITREEKRDPEPRRGARRVQRPRPRAAGPARPRPRRRKSA